jgi:hypothetical protein
MQNIHVASRKGLFTLAPDGDDWRIASHVFTGDPVTAVLEDPRDGTLYAALNLGHFGVKLHRSDDHGANWQEIAAPAHEEEKGKPPPDPMSGEWPPKKGRPQRRDDLDPRPRRDGSARFDLGRHPAGRPVPQ